MSKVQVDTIDTRSGTSTMQIGSTNTSTINIGVSGDTVNIPSGVTIANAGTATGFGEANTPYFAARLDGNQTYSDATTSKIAFDTEELDSDSAFTTGGSANFTVPSGKGGKYFLHVQGLMFGNDGNSTLKNTVASIRKNDTQIAESYFDYSSNNGKNITGTVSIIVDLSAGDIITFFAYADVSSGYPFLRGAGDRRTFCNGFRISAS